MASKAEAMHEVVVAARRLLSMSARKAAGPSVREAESTLAAALDRWDAAPGYHSR